MNRKETSSHVKLVAEKLNEIINTHLTTTAKLSYTSEPQMEEKDIIEYDSRMRISPMENFNAPCVISVVNFFASENDKKAQKAQGALVTYIEYENANRFLKLTGSKIKPDDDDDITEECSGKFCKTLAEDLVSRVEPEMFGHLILSEPASFTNNVPGGVLFHYDEYKLYELNYFLWKEKIFSADITMATK